MTQTKRTLDYQGSDGAARATSKFFQAAFGAFVGIAVTLPAVFAAIISAGAGHGHYFLARILFPLPLVCVTDSELVLVVLVLIQFPAYGAIIGACKAVDGKACLAGCLAIISTHCAVVAWLFMYPGPFS